MIIKNIVVLFFCSTFIFSQTDWVKWEAANFAYELKSREGGENSSTQKDDSKIIGAAEFVYKTFVSDLDGDNCPFYPSCSKFFVQAVGKTNILTGLLMFTDRFTRDLNFIKCISQYGFHSNGKLFDPVEKYILSSPKHFVKHQLTLPN